MKKVLASLLLLAGLCAQAKPTVFPVSLSCNDMVDPVAVSDVSFSWKLCSDVRAARQIAYELWVGSTPNCGGDVWKSGKVVSDDQLDITLPPTVTLEEGKRYFWKVRIWDGSGKVSPWTKAASFTKSIDNSWEADWIATGKTEDAGRLSISAAWAVRSSTSTAGRSSLTGFSIRRRPTTTRKPFTARLT